MSPSPGKNGGAVNGGGGAEGAADPIRDCRLRTLLSKFDFELVTKRRNEGDVVIVSVGIALIAHALIGGTGRADCEESASLLACRSLCHCLADMAVFQKDLLEFVQLHGEDAIPFVVPLFQPPITHVIEYVTAGKAFPVESHICKDAFDEGRFTGEVAGFRAAVKADLEDLWTDEEIRLPRRLVPESGFIGPIRCVVDESVDSVAEREESAALPSLSELHFCRQFIGDVADFFDEKIETQPDGLVFSCLPGRFLCGTQFAGDGDVTEEWRVLFPYYSLLSGLVKWGAVNGEMEEYVLGRSTLTSNPHISVSLHKIVATAIKYASTIVAKDHSSWTRESLRDKMRGSCASFLAGKAGVILLPKRAMPKDGLMFRLRCEIDWDVSDSGNEEEEGPDETGETQSVESVKESEGEPLRMPATLCLNTQRPEAGEHSQQPSFSVSFPAGFYLNTPDEKPFVAVPRVDVERERWSPDSDIVWETDDRWKEMEPQKLVVEIESDEEKERVEEEEEETRVSITIEPREEREKEVMHLQEYVELSSDDEEKRGEDDGDVVVLSDTEWVEETRKRNRKEKRRRRRERSRSRSGSAERIEARRLVSDFCAAWGADTERDGTRIAGLPSHLVSAKKGRSSHVQLLSCLRSSSLLPAGQWTFEQVETLRPVMQHLFKQYRLAEAGSCDRDRLAAELRSFCTVYWAHPTNQVAIIEPPTALRGRPLEMVNIEETCRHLLSEMAIEAGTALVREKLESHIRLRFRALPPAVCGVVWEHDKYNGVVDGPCALLVSQLCSLRLLPPLNEVMLMSRGSLSSHLYASLVSTAGAVLRSACSRALEQECRYLRVSRGGESRALQEEMRDNAAAIWHNTHIVVQSNIQLQYSLSVMIVDTRGMCVWMEDAPPLPPLKTRKDGEGKRKSVQEEMNTRSWEKKRRKMKEVRQERSARDWAERMKRHRDMRSRERSRSSSNERRRSRSRSRDRRSRSRDRRRRDRRSRSRDRRSRSRGRNRDGKRSRSRGRCNSSRSRSRDRDRSKSRSRDRSATPKRSRTGECCRSRR